MDIKDFSPKQASFFEHNWKIIACIVMTGERCLGSDIWPKTFNQDTGTEEMMLTIWYKEAMK